MATTGNYDPLLSLFGFGGSEQGSSTPSTSSPFGGPTTGPFLPQGTVSPLSDLFSQIPTGLANNSVTYTPNTSINTNPGAMFLPTGSQWTPRAGYDIVYGVKNGTYGHFQIPSADVANAAEKYGIGVMGSPLSVSQINYHNNPSGGPNQTQTPGTPPPSGSPSTPTTPSGSPTTPTTPPVTPSTPTTPQLPALDANRQRYLDAIDAYVRSQNQYQYAPSITDEMRRAMNLPGMAELQMNQAANPTFNPANFANVTSRDGLPFIPGSAAPQGFKWQWLDPDGTAGLAPSNYALTPDANFFDALPGSEVDDLKTLVGTLNDPKYANKYIGDLSSLGRFGNLLMGGQNGDRVSLAPQESINQLFPLLQRQDVYNYVSSLIGGVSGQLGSQYGPDYKLSRDIGDPTKVTNYFNTVNNALGKNFLPSIQDILGGNQRTLDNSQFYQGKSLDFYQPQNAAPAFFQYLLEDRDGTGPLPSTYGLRLKGAPDTRFDANKILETLNNPQYQRMIGANSNLAPYGNIFTSILNSEGNPIFKLLDSYKFPGGEGGPPSTGTGSGSLYSQSVSPGGAGGPSLSMERWTPSASDTLNANQQQADMAKNTTTQANSLNSVPSIYGGGDGTAGLGSTPSTTTTPAPFTPSTGTTPPATDTRKPSFFTPYSYWT